MSTSSRRFELAVLAESFAIVRLRADAPLPSWAVQGNFFSVTRTADELSTVCAINQVPSGLALQTGWRALKVKGPFTLSEIGVLAELTATLAQAKVSVFAISTFDTDYLLVSEKNLAVAIAALRAAGHAVVQTDVHV
jgi:hypothetical protein